MRDLFLGQGVAHTIMLLAFVIGIGIYLGRFKIKGVSIGATWILFMGILMSHLGFRADPEMLHFIKEFGLILFVFSIGLQVGPGFFHSLKSGGVKMNLLALVNVLLAVAVTWGISLITGVDLKTMVGVMSGAVTNTPGLGAAQQTYIDVASAGGMDPVAASKAASELASGYAVTYPIGVIGVILVLLVGKSLFKVDPAKELAELEAKDDTGSHPRRMHVAVENPAIFGKKLSDILHEFNGEYVVSRIMKGKEILFATGDIVLEEGDKVLIVTSQQEVEKLRILFGQEVPMHLEDWDRMDHHLVTRRLTVTKSSLTGKKLRDLHFREAYEVSVTRVIRTGVELVARPDLYLQMGDALICIGAEQNIKRVAEQVGNSSGALDKPNLVPIFLGIVVGIIFGSLPIRFPGIPQPIKLGLAGGPLIIAILLGHFGPKHKITTFTTMSANLMIREIGISLFLAAVGLGAGENFVSSIVNGGYWWILYGAIITIVPVFLTFVIARFLVRLNLYFRELRDGVSAVHVPPRAGRPAAHPHFLRLMVELVYPLEPAPVYPRPTVDAPGLPAVSSEEMLPLIEPSGLVYGQATRAWCHSGAKPLHPVVHLHLVDRLGRIYLQKRSMEKDLLPGYWDTAVGGHVTYGELAEEALYREAAEELGLTAFNPIFLETNIWETERDREFVFIFASVGHPDLNPDNDEVTEGRWWTQQELTAAIGKDLLTPNFEAEYARIQGMLLALL